MSPAQADRPQEEAQEPVGRRGPLADSLATFLAGWLSTLVALLTGGAALFFTLFPDLKPFAATEQRATMKILTVERAVTRDEWRWGVAAGDRARYLTAVDEDARAAGFPDRCGPGDAQGYVVGVLTDSTGFKRRELTLRAQLYDAASNRRIRNIADDLAALARVPIDTPTEAAVAEVWLWDPAERGARYFARISLYDSDGNLLAIQNSDPFRAISQRESNSLPTGCPYLKR